MTLNINGRLQSLDKPLVMGILNVTPDSFYAASRLSSETDIRRRAETIINEGGAIIDVGACSTRPDATPVSAQEEWKRLEPALLLLQKEFPRTPLSVDTFRPDIARRAVEEFGVAIINDVSGGVADAKMFPAVARLNVPYVLTYSIAATNTDVAGEALLFFADKLRLLRQLGLNDVIIDPGFGFNKSLDENYAVMRRLHEFSQMLECPLLVGVSRKSMLYNLLGCTPDESLNATTALNTFALLNGADILRVHDVKAAADAVNIVYKLKH